MGWVPRRAAVAMKVKGHHVAGVVLLAAAGGIAYLATRTVGNMQIPKFTETIRGPLQKQVVLGPDELHMERTFTHAHYPMRYPGQVAAGISQTIAYGFAPLHTPADPVVAALPAEPVGAGT